LGQARRESIGIRAKPQTNEEKYQVTVEVKPDSGKIIKKKAFNKIVTVQEKNKVKA
jgi:hypothetical protein